MARSRNIKPAFFKNESLAELPCETRILFIGLWTLADREGRLEDRPKRIRAEIFPFDTFNVESMLNELQSFKFLARYEIDGIRFIQITNFVKHQDPHYKEKASEIPAPNGCENIIKATNVTRSQRAVILERDEYKCQNCSSIEHLCIDHIIPASRGGDSSDDNLQVLCISCNTKKGNKLDGEVKGIKKSIHNQTAVIVRSNVESTSNQTQIKEVVTNSLIPDSLNTDSLNTDSLNTDSLNTDSLIPDSLNPNPSSTPRKKRDEKKTPLQIACRQTWESYSNAYFNRHGTEPTGNKTIYSQIKAFVVRIGFEESPFVAAFYVSHNERFYVQKMHPVGMLLKDAEGLRTQWATGRGMTATRADQIDKSQANASCATEAMEIYTRRQEEKSHAKII